MSYFRCSCFCSTMFPYCMLPEIICDNFWTLLLDYRENVKYFNYLWNTLYFFTSQIKKISINDFYFHLESVRKKNERRNDPNGKNCYIILSLNDAIRNSVMKTSELVCCFVDTNFLSSKVFFVAEKKKYFVSIILLFLWETVAESFRSFTNFLTSY